MCVQFKENKFLFALEEKENRFLREKHVNKNVTHTHTKINEGMHREYMRSTKVKIPRVFVHLRQEDGRPHQ